MSELHLGLMALSLCGAFLVVRLVGRRRRDQARDTRIVLGIGALVGGCAMLLFGISRL